MAMERKSKARAETGIYLLVVAAILVVANVISYRVYKRFDVTKNERFSLSKGSARLVATGLTRDLDLTLYVTRGLPKHEAFIQDLTDLLNEYERASNGHLHYTIVEPKTDDERAKAKEDGMQEAAFGEGSKTGKDQALISKGFMGLAFKYGAEKESIPMLSPEQGQGLEFWITNKIREIRDRADNKYQEIGILTGKDEIKLSDTNLIASQGRQQQGGPSMKGIIEQALPFYKFKDVDLQGGDAEIDKSLAGVIITQPGKDFTEKELRRIDQFLMLGDKSVAIFASAVNLKASDATMKAELNLHGLDKLLDGYGIEIKKDAVFDWARPAVVRVMTQGMPVIAGHPGTVLAQFDSRADASTQFLDQSFPGFFRMEELVFPFPSTLVMHAEKETKASMHVVARTTPRATAATTDTVEMKPARGELKPKGEYGQHAIAVAIEPGCCKGGTDCRDDDACKAGIIPSAFAGKPGDGIDAPAESKGKSRLLVVASAQFLANPFARSGNGPAMPPQMMMMGQMGGDEELLMISQPYAQQYLTETILAFKNTLDWMGGDSDLIAASAKLIGEPNLTYLDIEKPKVAAATDADAAKKQAEEYDAELTRVQRTVQWTMTLVPALLFALFGLVRWRIRDSRRSNLTLD
jgi:ABC-type uncharacterized transport system involved in gliding motility auxiliary subunit